MSKITDIIAAASPAVASIIPRLTLTDWNTVVNIAATSLTAGLGAAYLIWKWRREARNKASE